MKIEAFLDGQKVSSFQELLALCTPDNTEKVLRYINHIEDSEQEPTFAIDKTLLQSFKDCPWDDNGKGDDDDIRLNDADDYIVSPAYLRPLLYLSLQDFVNLDDNQLRAATAALVRHLHTSAKEIITHPLFSMPNIRKNIILACNKNAELNLAVGLALIEHGFHLNNPEIVDNVLETVYVNLCKQDHKSYKRVMFAVKAIHLLKDKKSMRQICDAYPVVAMLIRGALSRDNIVPESLESHEQVLIKLFAALGHDIYAEKHMRKALFCYEKNHKRILGRLEDDGQPDLKTTLTYFFVGESIVAPDVLPSETGDLLRKEGIVFVIHNDAALAAAKQRGDEDMIAVLRAAGAIEPVNMRLTQTASSSSSGNQPQMENIPSVSQPSPYTGKDAKFLLMELYKSLQSYDYKKIGELMDAGVEEHISGTFEFDEFIQQETSDLHDLLRTHSNIPFKIINKHILIVKMIERGFVQSAHILLDNKATIDPLVVVQKLQNDADAYLLLEKLNKAGTKFSVDTLQSAAQKNFKKSVQLICDTLSDKHAALVNAIEKNYVEAAQTLISGINVNQRMSNSMTLLILATEKNNRKMVEILLAEGADINAGAGYNNTCYLWPKTPIYDKQIMPIHIAIFNRNLEILRLFLEKGADINVVAQGAQSGVSDCAVLPFVRNLQAKSQAEGTADVWTPTIRLLTLWGAIDTIIKNSTNFKDCIINVLQNIIEVNTPKNMFGIFANAGSSTAVIIQKSISLRDITSKISVTNDKVKLLQELLLALSDYVGRELIASELTEDEKDFSAICNLLIMRCRTQFQELAAKSTSLSTTSITKAAGNVKANSAEQKVALTRALEAGNFTQVGLLLAAGCDTADIDFYRYIKNASEIATFSHSDFCEFLEKYVNSALVKKDPVLMTMAHKGYVKAATILLKNNAQAELVDLAVVLGKLQDKQDAYDFLLALIKAGATKNCLQALQIAAEKGFDNITSLLLNLIPDKNATLLEALAEGYLKAAEILINDGADLTCVSLLEVFHRLAENAKTRNVSVRNDYVRILMTKATLADKHAALVLAIQMGLESSASILLESVKVNDRTTDGQTLLIKASESLAESPAAGIIVANVAALLIKAGAEVNATVDHGGLHASGQRMCAARSVTPLYIASFRLNIPLVRLLLEKGANINIAAQVSEKNNQYYSPLQLIIERKKHYEKDMQLQMQIIFNLLSLWTEIDKIIINQNMNPMQCVDLVLEKFINATTPKTSSFSFNTTPVALPPVVVKAKEFRRTVSELIKTEDEVKSLSSVHTALSAATKELDPAQLDEDGKTLAALCNRLIAHFKARLEVLMQQVSQSNSSNTNNNTDEDVITTPGDDATEMREITGLKIKKV